MKSRTEIFISIISTQTCLPQMQSFPLGFSSTMILTNWQRTCKYRSPKNGETGKLKNYFLLILPGTFLRIFFSYQSWTTSSNQKFLILFVTCCAKPFVLVLFLIILHNYANTEAKETIAGFLLGKLQDRICNQGSRLHVFTCHASKEVWAFRKDWIRCNLSWTLDKHWCSWGLSSAVQKIQRCKVARSQNIQDSHVLHSNTIYQ